MTDLKQIFARIFSVDVARITEDAGPGTLRNWDSVRHLDLVLEIESVYGIELTAVEIGQIETFGKVRHVLETRGVLAKAPPLDILLIGACRLWGAGSSLVNRGMAIDKVRELGVSGLSSYSIGEAIQRVEFFLGRKDIPDSVRRFCHLPENFDPATGGGKSILDAKACLLEPNSPVDMIFDGYYLNRSIVISTILNPLREASGGATDSWYNVGLMAGNEEIRAEAARKIIPLIPPVDADAQLRRDILDRTRARRRRGPELAAAFATFRDLVGMPVGILTYAHQYMPDGRALPWPPEFIDEVIQAAGLVGLPVFDTREMIAKIGVAKTLKPDRVHYLPEFEPLVGDALLEFIDDRLLAAARASAIITAPVAAPHPASTSTEQVAGKPDIAVPSPEFAFQQELNDEVLAFMQEEDARRGEGTGSLYQWYKKYILNKVGLSPYDTSIPKFVKSKHGTSKRLVEIGAGAGQQSIFAALNGLHATPVESAVDQFDLMSRLVDRVARKIDPTIKERIKPILDWYPNGVANYVDRDAILSFPSVNSTMTEELRRAIMNSMTRASGVILGLRIFFILRHERAEQDELVRSVQDLGFAPPVEIDSWTGPRDGFMPDRIYYFENLNPSS